MKRWTDDELRLVLSHAPTIANANLLAAAMQRTAPSVAMVFRWALQTQATVDRQPSKQTFARRIKRIAKEIGWV